MTAKTAYRKTLCTLLVPCFAELLETSRLDDKRWNKLQSAIQRHGLLSSTIRIPRTSSLPQIDARRLEHDRKYRRSIARQLLKPQGPDFQQVVIPLDRGKLAEPEYSQEMSELLANRWAEKLLHQKPDVVDSLVLLRTTPETLFDGLDRLYRYQSTARDVSHRMFLRFAQEEIDRSAEVQSVFAEVNAAFDEIEERASSQFDEIANRMLSGVDEAFARIKEQTDAKFDALQKRIRERTVTAAASGKQSR